MFKTLTSAIDIKKTVSDTDIEKIPSFIFCKWLSGNPHSIFAGNQINYYHQIPIVQQYYMIKHAFAGKIRYIPYPKNITEAELKEVGYIADYFKISFEKAKEYIELINQKEYRNIVDMYKTHELKKS